MTTTLTDRYVHAVQRSVPEARREEIGRELRSSIDDMVDARDDLDRDEAERVVLTDLGDPGVLAAQYADRPLHLIGPRYFLTYWRLMLRLLTWIPGAVALVVLTVVMIRNDSSADAVGAAVSAGFQAAVQVVFWTTVVFAVLERVDVDPGLPGWTVDALPDAPDERDISLVDTVTALVFIGLFGVVLVVQNFRSWVQGPDGEDVAVLDPALWSGWLPLLLAVLVANAALEVWKHREGRWTGPIVAATSVVSLAFALPFAWLAWRDSLLNPEFVDAVGMNERVLGYVNDGIVAGAVVIVLIEVVDALWKLRRRRLASA
ncbi:permease prefix domain 1-containing protein [Aeromicrobium halocynthiae]|uniref:Permease prefix domain 1-containing protein n=1 Tax=Aeromicrobium halocynthiae TaxID=560557 RepID=A0ABN2W1H6_9ACTN